MHFRIWLSRTVFESMLIVLSILLALGVRAWQDERGVSQLIERSKTSFERELTLNKKTIDDLYPFHQGLQSLLAELEVESHPDKAHELRNILDSLQPEANLLTTAWDTALATGALAQMDYELVYALSLTYSFQERFRTLYNSGLIDQLSSNVTEDRAPTLAYAAFRYVNGVTLRESELLAAYQQALEALEAHGARPMAGPAPGAATAVPNETPANATAGVK